MSEFGKQFLGSLASGLGGSFSSVAGSLGSAVSGGLGQLFKSIQDKREHEYFQKRADYQQQLQHETMDKQQQQTIDFWNMQNEYNTPAAVAERYRNAGISPLAAFGGSVVGLGASSAPMPSAGSAYGAGAGGSALPAMDSPASVALAGSQVEKNAFENKYTDSLTRLTDEKVISEQLAQQIQEINLDVLRYTADNDKELSDLSVDEKRENIRAIQQRIKESIQAIKESISRENLNNEQRELLSEQIAEQLLNNSLLEIKLKYADKMEKAKLDQINADAWYLLKCANSQEALKLLYDAQTTESGSRADLNNSYRLTDEQKREFEGYFKAAKQLEAYIAKERGYIDASSYGEDMYKLSLFLGSIGQVLSGSVYAGMTDSAYGSKPTVTETKTVDNGNVKRMETTKNNLKKFVKKGIK